MRVLVTHRSQSSRLQHDVSERHGLTGSTSEESEACIHQKLGRYLESCIVWRILIDPTSPIITISLGSVSSEQRRSNPPLLRKDSPQRSSLRTLFCTLDPLEHNSMHTITPHFFLPYRLRCRVGGDACSHVPAMSDRFALDFVAEHATRRLSRLRVHVQRLCFKQT